MSPRQTYVTHSPKWRMIYDPSEGPEKGTSFFVDLESESHALRLLAEVRRLLEKAGEFNEAERYITHLEEKP